MTITAKVVLDSMAPNGSRLTTFELTYPRFIHAELMTHRVFSRNAASSRAIPTRKKIERIRTDCAKPNEWGLDKKGMQPDMVLGDEERAHAEAIWVCACRDALIHAGALDALKVHKQVANRILEPFDHITVVLSTTKLKNHFLLRLATDPVTGRPLPDPNYFELATKWKAAWDASAPMELCSGEWHLPYVTDPTTGEIPIEDSEAIFEHLKATGKDVKDAIQLLKAVSAARCARVSYMRQGQGDVSENVTLHNRLSTGGHWAPLEHVATPINGIEFTTFEEPYDVCHWCREGYSKGASGVLRAHGREDQDGSTHEMLCMKCAYGHVHSGNFHGWNQYRKEFAQEAGGE